MNHPGCLSVVHSPSYADIASSLALWKEYADPDGAFSDEEFEALTHEERIALLVETFGPEPTEAEVAEDSGFDS